MQKQINKSETILSLISVAILLLIFLKAIINIDTGYDAGWYHHLFAARIWRLIPQESFISEQSIEYRFDGFPLLAHFFQGLFWKLTGRIQSTNLVSYFSLIIYFFFLRSFFKIPLNISIIALLTIPAVLTHAATSFVDLPGNIGASVVIMMMFRFLNNSKLPNKKELLVVILGAFMAANTKFHLTVFIALLYCVICARIAWLYVKNTKSFYHQIGQKVLLGLLTSVLIFATPTKNLIVHGNPLYPIKVEFMGTVLNHKLTPKTYSEGNRPQRWLQSIGEKDTPEWSSSQYNEGNSKLLDRAGGFFFAYVIFNLVLLLIHTIQEIVRKKSLFKKDDNASIIALTIISFASLFTANFPQSHELRYLMFWMISLVSLNLGLLYSSSRISFKWLKPKYYGFVYLFFFIIVCLKINNYYLRPVFSAVPGSYEGYTSVEEYVKFAVKPELVAKMLPGERNCLIALHAIPNPYAVPYASIANAIFYSSYFHPEIEHDYSIKAVSNKNSCGNLRKIP